MLIHKFHQPIKHYTLQFEKDGYNQATSNLAGSLNAWYIGNIIFGGLIGILIIDPATGAMWRLDENVSTDLSINPISSKDKPLEILKTQ